MPETSSKEKIKKIKALKGKEKITMLTAYDFPTAKILDEAGVEIILVGDSIAMAVLGKKNTQDVSMELMLEHTKAVARAAKNALIVGDMPKGSFETPEVALESAKKFLEAGAETVKIEGNKTEIVKKLVENGIEVMGHVGLTPQTILDFKVQGKEKEDAERILNEAVELEQAGCFSLVLECIPIELAKRITEKVSIPTIGIGAGVHCDGQVLVINDLLGLNPEFKPKFLKRYANLYEEILKAIEKYVKEVKEERFPNLEHSYK